MHDAILTKDFNGLTAAQPAIPANWYYDPSHFELEMREILQKQWVYVCRSDALQKPGDYRVFEIGDQSIIVLRDNHGDIRGFYNTCRHRGSALCTNEAGTADRRLTCPYHQWTYALDGRLLSTGPMRAVAGFDRKEYGLFKIAVQ
ncbi:MAG: Rieske (2Fe-2S) protein, partial [Pseudomonadota bacterium]